MNRFLLVIKSSIGLGIQDKGRLGLLEKGLSKSGVADRIAMAEANALLGQKGNFAALEMCEVGGIFRAEGDIRIALTGAPMKAFLDGKLLEWNASHMVPNNSYLEIGRVKEGVFGYLSVGGGFDTPIFLSSRSFHLKANIGTKIEAGYKLPIGTDNEKETKFCLPYNNRFKGGTFRVVPSAQTDLFSSKELTRFTNTTFLKSIRGNRMGFALDFKGKCFPARKQLNILSDIISPGDIQMIGNGSPYVLLPECQTTGGYPRIGTVIPADLPKLAQSEAKSKIKFQFVTLQEAVQIELNEQNDLLNLKQKRTRLYRNPSTITDLLSYQLISGAVSATADTDSI